VSGVQLSDGYCAPEDWDTRYTLSRDEREYVIGLREERDRRRHVGAISTSSHWVDPVPPGSNQNVLVGICALFQVEKTRNAVGICALFQVEKEPKAVGICALFQVEKTRNAVRICALFQVEKTRKRIHARQ
jgi:hypothetical protein